MFVCRNIFNSQFVFYRLLSMRTQTRKRSDYADCLPPDCLPNFSGQLLQYSLTFFAIFFLLKNINIFLFKPYPLFSSTLLFINIFLDYSVELDLCIFELSLLRDFSRKEKITRLCQLLKVWECHLVFDCFFFK